MTAQRSERGPGTAPLSRYTGPEFTRGVRSDVWSVEFLALTAFFCLIALVRFEPNATTALVIVTLAGSLAVLGAANAPPWTPMETSALKVTPGLLVLYALSVVLLVRSAMALDALSKPQFAIPLLVTVAAGGGVWFIVGRTEASPLLRWLGAGLILVAAATTGAVYLYTFTVPDLDVLAVLRAGADALLSGANPYTDARTPETNPFGLPNRQLEGFTYPPLVLYLFTASQWLTGDVRWASIGAVAIVALLVAAPWDLAGPSVAKARLSLALLFVAPPALGIMTYFGWSELLSLPFLLLAGRFWRSRPVVSAIALGLALATKQYFLLALPLLLVWPDDFRWRRVAIACATVLATALPFLVLDAGALWDSLTGLTAYSGEARTDSLNLVHLGVVTPRWLAIGVATGVAVWLGRRGGEGYRFNLALASVLSAGFVFGVAAFRNYWYLVAYMALIAVANRYDAARVPDVRFLKPVPDARRRSSDAGGGIEGGGGHRNGG